MTHPLRTDEEPRNPRPLPGYSYYIEQPRDTLKRELKNIEASRDWNRDRLDEAIRCGQEDAAARIARRLAQLEKQRADCARAHDVLVYCEETKR